MAEKIVVAVKSFPLKKRAARFLGQIAITLAESFYAMVFLVIVTGIAGGALSTFAPIVFHLDAIIGAQFAVWCIERGSCDLDTNLVGLGLGIYLSLAILIILTFAAEAGRTPTQSIYYDVRDQLEQARETGVEPITIAKRSGHDLADVHTMLGYLFDDGVAEIVEAHVSGRRVRYRLVKNGHE